jgi:hypothetical protein
MYICESINCIKQEIARSAFAVDLPFHVPQFKVLLYSISVLMSINSVLNYLNLRL